VGARGERARPPHRRTGWLANLFGWLANYDTAAPAKCVRRVTQSSAQKNAAIARTVTDEHRFALIRRRGLRPAARPPITATMGAPADTPIRGRPSTGHRAGWLAARIGLWTPASILLGFAPLFYILAGPGEDATASSRIGAAAVPVAFA
jgi:hypothetical protein